MNAVKVGEPVVDIYTRISLAPGTRAKSAMSLEASMSRLAELVELPAMVWMVFLPGARSVPCGSPAWHQLAGDDHNVRVYRATR